MKAKIKTRAPVQTGVAANPVVPGAATFNELKLQKILVPVDFTPLSWKAVQYAIAFAAQFKAEIFLIHTVTTMPSAPEFQVSGQVGAMELHVEAVAQLAGWRDSIVTQARVKASVMEGLPDREILHAAEDNNIDLIIIGQHGHGGLWSHLVGGTTKRVLRGAPCPVLVVRDEEHDFLGTASQAEKVTENATPPKKSKIKKVKAARSVPVLPINFPD